MSIVLIVENVPVVAEDISETVKAHLRDVTPVIASSLKDAVQIVESDQSMRLCIVSGSAEASRLTGLATALSSRSVPTMVMTNHQVVADVFDTHAEILAKPFSSQMLSDALLNLNFDLNLSE